MTSAASPQFGTRAQVTIQPPFGPGIIVNPDLSPGVVQGRVDWQVIKGIGGSTPSTCSIRVYNLGASSRARAGGIVKRVIDFTDEFAFLDGRLITGADLGGTSTISTANGFGSVKLLARYQGSATTAKLFEGTASFVDSDLKTNTWVTTITGSDGVIQNTSALGDRFWGHTVTAPEVLDYLVKRSMASELATPYPPELAAWSFVGGFDATNYLASDLLDQITAITKTEWWIDDGAVYFASLGLPLPVPPILLSTTGAPGTTRMIGRPRPIEGGLLEVPCLMLPELRPKSPVTILSAEHGGSYWASAVRHNGSNRAGVSRTTATLTPLGVVGFLG